MPLLCGLCIAGLVGLIDCYTVTLIFTGYILFDLSWILLYPEALPRYPHVIIVHHVITLALLSHPLRFRQDARFTCLARPAPARARRIRGYVSVDAPTATVARPRARALRAWRQP